ncbi:MAG: PQQ-binding-like beta-propeller repeat protein [Planctomycetaceae bacterium]
MNRGKVSFEQHSLTNLLYRDAGYGLLSSDGQRVFSVENSVLMPPASFSWWGNNSPESQDPYERDWSSNQIHAYDLATGERLWEAGGRRMHEQFDPPLAGVFFFGPPVEDDGELFAVGEQDGEVRLFALAADTGRLLWSQDLAPTEAGIVQDLTRRLWAAMPAVDAGMVFCPTTSNRLVAVDRHTHRIVWVYDFAARSGGTPVDGARLHAPLGLNDRWCASAPIVSAGRVLLAPPELPNPTGEEQPRLICLDVRTGERLWDLPKAGFLYVAGVFADRVLLVGQNEVAAVKLADGTPLWSVPVPAPAGPPSGRGIAVAEQYLLPLVSGALWTIDIASGKVVRRDRRPGGDDVPPLGNLGVWNGMLLSLGPFGLTGFEQRTALQEQIAARRQQRPGDLWAAVRDAEMHTIAGEHTQALEVLDRARPETADPPELQARHRKLTFESLLTLVREQPEGPSAALERAAALAAGDAERLEVERLTIDRHIAARRWEEAAGVLRSIAEKFPNETMIDDGLNRLRLDVWLGGRLTDVVAQAPPAIAEPLAEQIANLLESSSLEMPAAASLERIYGFHAAARTFIWRLIEDAAFRRDFAGAELRLRRLIESGDRTTAAAALFRLGELLVEFDQPDDAAVVFAQLETQYGDVVLPTLQTGAEAARALFASGRLTRAALQPPVVADWTGDRLRLQRYRMINPEFSTPQPPVMRQLDAPFYRRHFIELDPQTSMMSIVRSEDETAYWRIPLRVSAANGNSQAAALVGVGLQAIVLHRGVLQALSLPDRRVVWSRIAAERASPMYARQIYDVDPPTLMPVSSFLTRSGLGDPYPKTGLLALATTRYVACYGRGEIVFLDPLSGEVLWRRRGVLPHTTLKGNSQTVFVIPPNASEPFALRAADGRAVAAPDLAARVKNAVAVTRSGLVRVDRKPAGRASSTSPPRLRVFVDNPLTGETAWQHEFSRARLTFLNDRQLLVLEETSGVCALLELESGNLQPLGNIPAALVKTAEVHVIDDPERVYLVFNDGGGGVNYLHPPALRINGTLVSLPRDSSGVVWQQAIENQNLLRTHFEQSPLLVCLAYDHVRMPEIDTEYSNGRLLVLDKGDGHVVAQETRAHPHGNYYRLDVNRAERAIDIRTQNERVRIQAEPEKQAAAGG